MPICEINQIILTKNMIWCLWDPFITYVLSQISSIQLHFLEEGALSISISILVLKNKHHLACKI